MSDLPPTAKRLNLHKPKQTPRPDRQHYGGLHQKLRRQLIEQRPLCEAKIEGVCTGWSTEAHHLVYKQNMTLSDYMAVCAECHRRITLEEKRRRDG